MCVVIGIGEGGHGSHTIYQQTMCVEPSASEACGRTTALRTGDSECHAVGQNSTGKLCQHAIMASRHRVHTAMTQTAAFKYKMCPGDALVP